MPYAVVLGSPVAHSLSPVLWRAAYRELDLDGWDYHAQECDADALAAALAAHAAASEWRGASLTMPLKRVAMDLVEVVDGTAAAIGAVNTVVRAPGRLLGHNTDVPGVVDSLTSAGIRPERTVVLGAGGTALAVLAALDRLGTPPATFAVRDVTRAAPLLAAAEQLGTTVRVVAWNDADVGDADLVVNTTPAGAADALAGKSWPATCALFDVVYAPWPTPLARVARVAGAVVVDGLELLVRQAVHQVELVTGGRPSATVLRAAGSAALAARVAGGQP